MYVFHQAVKCCFTNEIPISIIIVSPFLLVLKG